MKLLLQTKTEQDDLMPISLIRVLFTSGGMTTMNHERVLLQGSEIRMDSQDCMCNTVAGQFNANKSVVVEDFD